MQGRFITVEGVEGAGKSTQINFICQYLEDQGISVARTREPGGTELGEKIRELLLSNSTGKMHGSTELMLMFAARNEHIQKRIIPVLAQGDWVLSDRFSDASYAYQGGGRGLDTARISQLESWVLQNFVPDMTFLLDVPVEIGMRRVEFRGEKDRIEQESLDFFNRVRNVYIARSKQYPERIKLIDASKNSENISNKIQEILKTL